MTTTEMAQRELSAPAAILWSSPDINLWVATIAGEYAGMIEFSQGHFVVSDATGSLIATTTNIPAAQDALENGAAPQPVRQMPTGLTFKGASLLSRAPRTSYRRSAA